MRVGNATTSVPASPSSAPPPQPPRSIPAAAPRAATPSQRAGPTQAPSPGGPSSSTLTPPSRAPAGGITPGGTSGTASDLAAQLAAGRITCDVLPTAQLSGGKPTTVQRYLITFTPTRNSTRAVTSPSSRLFMLWSLTILMADLGARELFLTSDFCSLCGCFLSATFSIHGMP